MGTSVDITGRKQMEESIREAAREWQATFDSIPHAVMILDRDFKILRHNAAAVSFLKVPSLKFRSILSSFDPWKECAARGLSRQKNSQDEKSSGKRNLRCRNKGLVPGILGSHFGWGRRGVSRIVHGIKDITERVEAEEKARLQWEELAHVTRIGIMGELTSSLAHEINQPLTAIQSNAAAARRFLSASEPDIVEVRQILDDIISDNTRAGNIIRKIRSLLKRERSLSRRRT
jgi:two-component system sensor kinase FixL